MFRDGLDAICSAPECTRRLQYGQNRKILLSSLLNFSQFKSNETSATALSLWRRMAFHKEFVAAQRLHKSLNAVSRGGV
jgi:hypothetical protein